MRGMPTSAAFEETELHHYFDAEVELWQTLKVDKAALLPAVAAEL